MFFSYLSRDIHFVCNYCLHILSKHGYSFPHHVYNYIAMLESHFQNFKSVINAFCKSKTEWMSYNKVKTS